jgi:hypothetical protein
MAQNPQRRVRKGKVSIMQTRHLLIAVLFGLIGMFLSPPVHSTTLGLADNTTYNIFIDSGGDGIDFAGTLTTGVSVVTDFQLQMFSTVFDFTAPSDSSDDTVSQNDANVFSITDNTPPGFNQAGSLTLNANGTWSGGWFAVEGPFTFFGSCPFGGGGDVGIFDVGGGTCVWSAAAVPEPSSLLLIAAGLIALGIRRNASH